MTTTIIIVSYLSRYYHHLAHIERERSVVCERWMLSITDGPIYTARRANLATLPRAPPPQNAGEVGARGKGVCRDGGDFLHIAAGEHPRRFCYPTRQFRHGRRERRLGKEAVVSVKQGRPRQRWELRGRSGDSYGKRFVIAMKLGKGECHHSTPTRRRTGPRRETESREAVAISIAPRRGRSAHPLAAIPCVTIPAEQYGQGTRGNTHHISTLAPQGYV